MEFLELEEVGLFAKFFFYSGSFGIALEAFSFFSHLDSESLVLAI
jgi:hypothetical protein